MEIKVSKKWCEKSAEIEGESIVENGMPEPRTSSSENLISHWNAISVELALRKLEKVSTATLYAIGQRDAADLVQQARYELRKYKQNEKRAGTDAGAQA